jgi:hypothetical protein
MYFRNYWNSRGPDPTRSGPAAWPGGAHPAGHRPRPPWPARTPPPAVHAWHDPSLPRPLQPQSCTPRFRTSRSPRPSPVPHWTETSPPPPVSSSPLPPTICRFRRPSSRASTTRSSRQSRCISSAPHHHLLNAGAPPPLADRACRHGWPSPAVCRPYPSKVSSPSCSPRSPPSFPSSPSPSCPRSPAPLWDGFPYSPPWQSWGGRRPLFCT